MSLYIFASGAVRELLQEHLKHHRWTDSGFDIPLVEQIVEPDDDGVYTFGLGIQVAAVNDDGAPVPCLLLARSSIYKSSVRLCNAIGLIDAGYRGEVKAKVDVLDSEPEDEDVEPEPEKIKQGTRLFQLVHHTFLPWKRVVLVDALRDLPAAPDGRGAGGFGSTG